MYNSVKEDIFAIILIKTLMKKIINTLVALTAIFS